MTDERTEELAYLQLVYQELLAAKENYTAQLAAATQKGKALLDEFGHDTKLNFDSYAENLETLAMLEMKNREIDQWNLKNQNNAKQLAKVERLLQVPYFGKIVLSFDDSPSDQETFYIGVNDFTSLEANTRVHDWRSPIASLFYNNVLGATQYQANQTTIPVHLGLKRQFLIEKNHLLNYFDTTIAIQDDVLLHTLEADASPYMKEITTTIQQEQNEIIREERHPILLVNGIAGSGKTSVIMQRIAYLLYQNRQTITADNILLLSPNSTFIDYISQVLPNLGERNPSNLTMLQFLRFTSQTFEPLESEATFFHRIAKATATEPEKVLRSADFVAFLKGQQTASISVELFQDIRYKKQRIFTAETIFFLYCETPSELPIRKRLAATKEKLSRLWQRQLHQQAASRQLIDQMRQLTEAEQLRYFGSVLTDDQETTLATFALKRLRKKYHSVTKAIDDNEWINEWAFFQTFYQAYQHQPYQRTTAYYSADELTALLWVKHLMIEDLANQELAFLLIDEVQDYTEAQLLLLFALFPKATITLAGDENQAIFNTALGFEEIRNLLAPLKRPIAAYQLVNSYRSSKEITRLFQTLVNDPQKLQIVALRPAGQEPNLTSCENEAEYLEILTTIIADLPTNGTGAIITKNQTEQTALTALLEAKQLQHKNWQILSIDLAKGLEFDQVIVHNPSAERYYTERDRKILYTAISRGMKRVSLPYIGTLTPWLRAYQNKESFA